MTMIIATAMIDGGTDAFETDLRDLFQKYGMQVDCTPHAGYTHYNASLTALPVPDIANAVPAADTPSMELPPTELPQEVEVTLATAQDEVGAELPPEPMNIPTVEVPALAADVPAQPFKDVVLKSLSVACTVPSFIDRTVPASFLRASNVTQSNDFVSFTYCGMSYQFPVQKNVSDPFLTSPICNANIVYTDTSIRVVIEIVPNNVSYPCLLQVIDKGNTVESVTFGQDLAELVSVES